MVEVIYAGEKSQLCVSLYVEPNTTVIEAIEASQILKHFPEITDLKERVGIFGVRVSLETILKAGDRVEIYRPLIIDPKEARRIKALKQKKQQKQK